MFKVTIPESMKKIITLADMPAVKQVIQHEEDDGMTAQEYAVMAASS